MKDHIDQSGILLLNDGLDAFVGRALPAEKAERSIDVQYYMFHQDTVGQLLIRSLISAADRGVRVRMLIDDMYGEEADNVWTTLDSHPNMEVRLFNPFVRGSSKNLQFITRLSDVYFRMHSKSFTVDKQATIVGGRNIGDEYFDADQDLAFADIDMLAVGPVVPEVSRAFDQYWNSLHAYPTSIVTKPAAPESLPALTLQLDTFLRQTEATRYLALPCQIHILLAACGLVQLTWPGLGQRSFTTPPKRRNAVKTGRMNCSSPDCGHTWRRRPKSC